MQGDETIWKKVILLISWGKFLEMGLIIKVRKIYTNYFLAEKKN